MIGKIVLSFNCSYLCISQLVLVFSFSQLAAAESSSIKSSAEQVLPPKLARKAPVSGTSQSFKLSHGQKGEFKNELIMAVSGFSLRTLDGSPETAHVQLNVTDITRPTFVSTEMIFLKIPKNGRTESVRWRNWILTLVKTEDLKPPFTEKTEIDFIVERKRDACCFIHGVAVSEIEFKDYMKEVKIIEDSKWFSESKSGMSTSYQAIDHDGRKIIYEIDGPKRSIASILSEK